MGMLIGASIVQRGSNREEGVKTTPASIIVGAVNKQLQGKEPHAQGATRRRNDLRRKLYNFKYNEI